MKKNLAIALFLTILVLKGNSQGMSNLTVNGEVAGTTSENPLSDANINVYVNNTEIFKSTETNSKGHFQLTLPTDKKMVYKIVISYPGFASKSIEVDTRGVPSSELSFVLGQLGFLLLKENLTGFWSRQINQKDRLIYTVNDNLVVVDVISAMGHYSDK